jgi:hypothetical protein
MVVSVGMKFECTVPLTSQKAGSMTFLAENDVLGAGILCYGISTLVVRLIMIHLDFIPGNSVAEEFVTFTFVLQLQLSTAICLLMFLFHGEHSGNTLHAQFSLSKINSCEV